MVAYDTLENALNAARGLGYPLVELTPAAERELDPGVNHYRFYDLELIEEEFVTDAGEGTVRYYEVYGYDRNTLRYLAAVCRPDGRCLECKTYVAVEETHRHQGFCRQCWVLGLTDDQAVELREEQRREDDGVTR